MKFNIMHAGQGISVAYFPTEHWQSINGMLEFLTSPDYTPMDYVRVKLNQESLDQICHPYKIQHIKTIRDRFLDLQFAPSGYPGFRGELKGSKMFTEGSSILIPRGYLVRLHDYQIDIME